MNFGVHFIFGLVAGILSFLAFVLYYISIVRGTTIPNRATWLILTIVGVLVSLSYYSVGAIETMWVPICNVIGTAIAFLLSIKYGESKWSTLDMVCISVSILSVIIWGLTKTAILVLLINIFIDFLGVLPTIKKSYLNPKSESYLPWLVTTISCVLNIFAIQDWRFSIFVYPIYMLVFNGIITLPLLLFRFNSSFKK